ncbi:DUF3800 domain-containing protein [Yersinia aleksiciae]|uniref:DUF3800 domain-containing protein n=1 Tax=Yersinia aleksiciae TaxID=263819 RepID=UPI00119D85A5|nr:DUF3800 domain-containing protein [Yersinia aleksiciae]
MLNKYFLDESGNTGDLVKLPPDLNFASQPFFALSCIGVADCDDLQKYIDSLKNKHKIQGEELKSKNLYKSNPKFICDLFDYIAINKLPFYVEVVDKKYCIAVSIVNHQICSPYFQQFDSEANAQGFRNELADYLSENLPLDCYKFFFEACIYKSDAALLKSMKNLRSYFNSREFTFQYKAEAIRCLQSTIRFYHTNKSSEPDLIKNLIPIPDVNKRGNEIHLLPHVHSWFNLMAKVNKLHGGDISDVTFFHDKQDHFDEILIFCSEQLKNSNVINPFDPTTDFNIKTDLDIKFPDSKKSSGIQLADVLAGYISRYVMEYLYDESLKNDLYHDVFYKLKDCYDPNKNFGINFVLPINKRSKIFEKFNL